MKKFVIGVLVTAAIVCIAGLVRPLLRPIRDITVVRVHVTVDPALPHGKLWIGDSLVEGRDVWIELSGSSRRRHELVEIRGIWTADPTLLATMIEPRGTLVSAEPGADLFREVLVAHGDYPVRGFRGTAEVDGEQHPWLWLLSGDPDESLACGVALRGDDRGRPLVARDVLLPVVRTRETSKTELLLFRRRVEERVIAVEFSNPR